jgi:hypothetical protein
MEVLQMRWLVFALSMASFLLVTIVPAHAEIAWGDGSWQLELSGGPGTKLGSSDRTGDLLFKGTVEYEIPATKHLTLGLRLLPLFVLEQDGASDDTVYGAGAGLGGRLYCKASEYKGFFAEANVHALGHKNRIAGNSSNINFLTGLGVGYKFQQGWHTVLRWEHISNANLGEENAGMDAVTLGVGFTF